MRKWALPVLLGVITFALLLWQLYPNKTPKVQVVVAARDLGAGIVLQESDLTVKMVREGEAPTDAVPNPTSLTGKSLAVVRFQGEAITPRHLGPAVSLGPDERAIAVKVTRDTGLAGILRPGMKVGVVATLRTEGLSTGSVYAKATLEGLRVLYIPPEFMERESETVVAQTTVKSEEEQGFLSLGSEGSYNSPSYRTAEEGVIVLAVSTRPMPVIYVPATAPITSTTTLSETSPITSTLPVTTTSPLSESLSFNYYNLQEPAEVRWVNPLELLAALNAAGHSLTLYLVPNESQGFATSGLLLDDLVVGPTPTPKSVIVAPGGEK